MFPDIIVRDSERVFTLGEEQHQVFCRTRFILGTLDLQDSKITKNMLKLPKDANEVLVENPRITITEQMYNKIRDACIFRVSEAKSLFTGEISGLPECFVNKKDATPYHNTKAAIIPLITEGCVRPTSDDVEGLIVDLSVIIRAQSAIIPKGKTFNELSSRVLTNISDTATYRNADRIDIVADQYSPRSIKYYTREGREAKGSGNQIEFNNDTLLPDDFEKSFLVDEKNKSRLNELIAENCRNNSGWAWTKQFCVTNNLTNVITNRGERSIYPPNMIEVLEEADNRIVWHVMDMLECGVSKISVRTKDSDVVVILLSYMSRFLEVNPNIEMYVDFNSGDSRKNISLNDCHQVLGNDLCLALPFFHCFSGADATSAFYKMTKKTWLSHWSKFPLKDDLTNCFKDLSWCPSMETVTSALKVIAKFVMFSYNSRMNDDDLDEFRFQLFQRSSTNDLRNLPPSAAALVLHINRSAYQAGWVWGNTLTLHQTPSAELWGWKLFNEHLFVKWTFSSTHVDLDPVLGICRCRTLKCVSCKCAKNSRKCLTYCSCTRKCTNT